MRTLVRATAALVLCAAAGSVTWAAADDTTTDRTMKLVAANLEKGQELLNQARKEKTNGAKLDALDRALYFLRRAHSTTPKGEADASGVLRRDVDATLVRALDDQAEIYYARKSLSLAKKRDQEALAIDRQDARARVLADLIYQVESTDIFTAYQGTIAIQRIRDRRAAVGMPLRDRGLTGRR